MQQNFHLSLPCLHVDATRKFYKTILGAEIGRSAQNWIDVDLFGNQITFAKVGKYKFDYPKYSFGHTVLPSFHFGVILSGDLWKKMHTRIKKEGNFHIPETMFLEGKTGEHKSFFVQDPNGYIIEFKCFKEATDVFKS